MFPVFSNKSVVILYILLWMTVEKPSFLQNVAEEIRPGCRNLQKSVIMVNFSEILLGGIQYKKGLSELKSSLMCRFKDMGWCREVIIGGK